jgi:hypothetical protein
MTEQEKRVEIAYMQQGLEQIKPMVSTEQYTEREAYVAKRTKELGGDSNDQDRANSIY